LGFTIGGVLCLWAAAVPGCSQSLRDAADQAGVLIGTAVRPAHLSEPAYASTLAREFNMIEAEDAMKWRALRPNKSTFDFRQGDSVVRFAKAHNMKVRGHCLVWGRDNPDWLIRGNFNATQLSRILQQHIARVVKHYANQVFAWDVINEALDEQGNLRDSIWYNQPGIRSTRNGTAYIEQAFRWAHKADRHALLFFNEAEAEGLNRKSDVLYAMVKSFKERGVPIDGVGLQMHVSIDAADAGSIARDVSENIARLTALGLQVQITELDVSVAIDESGWAKPEDLAHQAAIFGSVARACLEHQGCSAIQTWGFADKYSWIGSHSHGSRGQALLFDREYAPKSAYNSLLRELESIRPSARQ